MKTYISVPIPTHQFLDLADFLQNNQDPRDPVDMVALAIDYWMDNASWKPELLMATDGRGYQWKSLFLPEKTQIRMQYRGTYFYAKVESDAIIYQGKSISPGQLANTITQSNRNAWRDLWIKRPVDHEWKLADDCRREQLDSGHQTVV
ncbi:hypothetical protein KEF85_09290 [Methylomonas paludis]|uniref:Uncharacterized protein n=1 Tax=Methylomonas paludis TaxID=1173101 RepID=A0A975R8V8_9GAMM|nr:hypothetical protein [Methylomonas paludis]QWF69574.1 hypothetical protein KEF85_09290 [Methylomonas paludis]